MTQPRETRRQGDPEIPDAFAEPTEGLLMWIRCTMLRSLWMLLFLLGGAAAGASGAAPVAVSPTADAGVARIESRCPTFLWGGVAGAEGYELRVYRAGPEDGLDQQSPGAVALAKRLPGSAHGWKPVSRECLDRGGRYGWTVRALFAAGVSDWSEPSAFEIAAELSPAEARELLQALRGSGDAVPPPRQPPAAGGRDLPFRTDAAKAKAPPPPSVPRRSVAERPWAPAVADAVPELWITVPAAAFRSKAGNGHIYSEGVLKCGFRDCWSAAPLHLPHGSRIVGIELEGCANSPLYGWISVTALEETTFDLPSNLVWVSRSSEGCGYSLAPAPVPHLVDQFFKHYELSLHTFDDTDDPDNDLNDFTVAAVRVYCEPNGSGVVQPTAQTSSSLFP